MHTLGEPDEYEAFIVDSLTQETIDVVPWSAIDWQRTRNDVSRSTVTCNRQKGIRPKWFDISPLQAWSRSLVVQRNGFRMWDGPITGWGPNGDQGMTIKAADRSLLLERRLLSADIDLSNTVTNSLYADLLVPAFNGSGVFSGSPFLYSVIADAYSDATTLHGVTDVDVSGAWRFNTLLTLKALLDNLAKSAFLCWTQHLLNLNLFIDRMPLRFTLRPEYIVGEWGDIGVMSDGEDIATAVYRGDTGQGIAGFPNSVAGGAVQTYISAVLYGVLPDAATSDVVWYQNDALGVPYRVDPQQYVNAAPVITLENVTLSPDCYMVDDELLTDLMPGSIINLDFPDSWSLNTPVASARPDYDSPSGNFIVTDYATRIQYARMEQVDVSVARTDDSLTETVNVSMTAWATD